MSTNTPVVINLVFYINFISFCAISYSVALCICDLFMMVTVVAGSDAILLGAETLRGLYPVETISTVGRICAEVSNIRMPH